MLSAAFNNPAGGLRYHLRAWRQGAAWQPFRAGLAEWLDGWRPQRSTLAIVGPSAGHCLPLAPLRRFERLIIFELDPLARFILKRRLHRAVPGVPVTWIARDLWIDPVRYGAGLPEQLVGPDGALLFSNIIGQLPFLLDPREYPEWRDAFRKQLFPWLERTPWASFHDRVSGAVPPWAALPDHDRQLTDPEVAALYEGNTSDTTLELNDHRSQDLLPEARHYHYLHWPITPTKHHLIECASGGPDC